MSDAFRRGIRPPSGLAPPEWAGENVRLQNSERSPFFDISQTPWWREPMELAGDSEVHNIVCLAPTGSGKSTMFEGLIPWVISEDPGPLLYACQTDPDAKFWAESRLMPALKGCSALTGLWPDDRHASRKLEVIFPHMPLVLGGANMSNFQEKSMRWLIGDEVWAWNSGLVREFLARHHNRWNRKVYMVSQGGFVGDELDQEWEKTDKGKFSFECPECGTVQPWIGKQLRTETVEDSEGVNVQATANSATYHCAECPATFADTVNNRRALSDSGRYVGQKSPLDGFRGFQVHALAIWWVPWSEYALERYYAQEALKKGVTLKLEQLTQKRDAMPWDDNMSDSREPIKRGGYSKEDYAGGTPIDDEAMRFMTVDVGGDHYWAVIQAWRRDGSSRILWEGYVGSDQELLDMQSKHGVVSSLCFIDTGFDTGRIYDFCVANGWTGIRGDRKERYSWPDKTSRLYSQVQRVKAPSGGTALYVFVAVDKVKDVLYRLRTGQGAKWEVPANVSNAFLNQIDGEQRKTFTNSKTGEEATRWVKVRANHMLDCCVYQVAAAMMMGIFDGEEGK